MERLIEILKNGRPVYIGKQNPYETGLTVGELADLPRSKYRAIDVITEVFNALAAYEDTGLAPAEVAELAKAKADGRLVVLPCKVGETVYDRFCDAWTVREIDLYEDEKVLARCGHKGTDDYCALYSDEIFLTREEAEVALRKEQSDER